jgi:anti-anti-sigma factor
MTPGDLTIEISPQPNATIVTLIGAADLVAGDKLDRQIMILSAQHPKCVIFDLSKMTFISSLCMGSLVRFRNACGHWGGKMFTSGANETVGLALKRARLDLVLDLRPSVEDALAACGM